MTLFFRVTTVRPSRLYFSDVFRAGTGSGRDESRARRLCNAGARVVYSVLVALHEFGVTPFDRAYEGTPAHDFVSANNGGAPAPIVRPVLALVSEDLPLPSELKALDREIVERCRELACRNLEIGRLFSSLVACQGRRALGSAATLSIRLIAPACRYLRSSTGRFWRGMWLVIPGLETRSSRVLWVTGRRCSSLR